MHKATTSFWEFYRSLPVEIRQAADKQFTILKANPKHPSVQFKKIGIRAGKEIWSARVTLKYRALAFKRDNGYTWFWIGEHHVYNLRIK